MTSTVGTELRKDWLLKTLYALRGQFRAKTPDTPDNLGDLPSGTEGLIIHCADGRQQEFTDLRLGRGEYYGYTRLGTNLPSDIAQQRDIEFSALLSRALLHEGPSLKPRPPKNLIIIGHSHCGANNTLLTMQLDPKPEYSSHEARFMHSKNSPELGIAIRAANQRGVKREQLHDEVTKSTLLQSMYNAFDYRGGNNSLSTLTCNGQLHIIAAMRGTQMENGTFPLEVYDPQAHTFRNIEALYDELFPGNNERTAEKIETCMNQTLSKSRNFAFSGDRGITVQMVKHNVDVGLHQLVEKIRSMTPTQTARAS